MKSLNAKTIIALATLTALAACGGGSGGSTATVAPITTPTTPTAPVTPPSADKSSIVTSVPAATYPAGSEELAAFKLLNAERQHCGFGLLKQNAKLDKAAKAHANYFLKNGYTLHNEYLGDPDFTGVQPDIRIKYQNYANGEVGEVGEMVAHSPANSVEFIHSFAGLPYHGTTAFRNYRDVGISLMKNPESQFIVIDLAYSTSEKAQLPAVPSLKNEPRTYPCDGSKNVNRYIRKESPDPFEGTSRKESGSAILVFGDDGTELKITSAIISEAENPLKIVNVLDPVTYKTNPNQDGYPLRHNEGYILPDTALEKMTKYTVTITGTNNSAPFTKTFTFTTGNQP